jgi:hypothetical protein
LATSYKVEPTCSHSTLLPPLHPSLQRRGLQDDFTHATVGSTKKN